MYVYKDKLGRHMMFLSDQQRVVGSFLGTSAEDLEDHLRVHPGQMSGGQLFKIGGRVVLDGMPVLIHRKDRGEVRPD